MRPTLTQALLSEGFRGQNQGAAHPLDFLWHEPATDAWANMK